jgi:hypothetical protein
MTKRGTYDPACKDQVFATLRREILAARLKVTLDEQLNRETSPMVKRLARMKLPPIVSIDHLWAVSGLRVWCRPRLRPFSGHFWPNTLGDIANAISEWAKRSRSRSGDLNNRLDFHRETKRKRTDPDSRSGWQPFLAERDGQHFGGAVGNKMVLGELGRTVHKDESLQDTVDSVQSADVVAHSAEQGKHDGPRGLLSFRCCKVRAQLATMDRLSVRERPVPGNIEDFPTLSDQGKGSNHRVRWQQRQSGPGELLFWRHVVTLEGRMKAVVRTATG